MADLETCAAIAATVLEMTVYELQQLTDDELDDYIDFLTTCEEDHDPEDDDDNLDHMMQWGRIAIAHTRLQDEAEARRE